MTSRLLHLLRTRLHTSGVSALFAPRKPRHALARALFGLLGLALLAVLLVIGVFVGAAMLIGGLLLRVVQPTRPVTARGAGAGVMHAEYRVVHKSDGQPLLR